MNNRRIRRARNSRRGQTIVIALLVLLLLAFAGALFVTVVARNLINAGHQVRHMTAEYYSQQGIQFVDDQLTNSVDGADWRPPVYTAPYNPDDPDAPYLFVFDKNLNKFVPRGYYRYNVGGGRYLVKVSYNYTDPNIPANDPLKKLIKIESVGREGAVNQQDPTTWQRRNQTATYRVAYKAIGITDYARFETNIDKRTEIMPIGVPSQYDSRKTVAATRLYTPGVDDVIPNGASVTTDSYPLITTLGAPDAYVIGAGGALTPNQAAGTNPVGTSGFAPGGGTFRSNASVRFFGENILYVNSGATGFGESAQIAGNLLLDRISFPSAPDPSKSYLTSQPSALIVDPGTGTPAVSQYVTPSNDPNGFDSIFGSVRDGKPGNDINSYPRDIKRLDPPVIDTVNTGTGYTRYTNLAINSNPRSVGYLGSHVDPATKLVTGVPVSSTFGNAAIEGYGKVIYVNNSDEVQAESSNLTGGYTLVDDWLNRTSNGSKTGNPNGRWLGDIYEPPGVQVILGRIYALANHPFGVTLIRNSGYWKSPDGKDSTDNIMYIPFQDVDADGTDPKDPAQRNPLNPNNDVMIVTAGNVRVFGVVSEDDKDTFANDTAIRAINKAAKHITIVSNATAYIDGSILKGNPASSVAIMARDYVCVNTTQFTAGPLSKIQSTNLSLSSGSDYVVLHRDKGDYLSQILYPGLLPGQTANATYPNTSMTAAYYSASPENGQANLDFSLFDPEAGVFKDNTNGASSDSTAFAVTPIFTHLTQSSLDMSNVTIPTITGGPAFSGLLPSQRVDLFVDNNNQDASLPQQPNTDVDLKRVAILPADIRIEAMMYAQNRSFFVIPGKWFNTDPTDSLSTYISKLGSGNVDRPNEAGATPAPGTTLDSDPNNARFPFYAQPIDLKITIYGAVSEARPADLSAQTDWMRKWGWIPSYHGGRFPGGSSALSGGKQTETAGHVGPTSANGYPTPAMGLSMIYDPIWGYPVLGSALRWSGDPAYYTYALPYAPKLPVCPGLLFSAQPQQSPLP